MVVLDLWTAIDYYQAADSLVKILVDNSDKALKNLKKNR